MKHSRADQLTAGAITFRKYENDSMTKIVAEKIAIGMKKERAEAEANLKLLRKLQGKKRRTK